MLLPVQWYPRAGGNLGSPLTGFGYKFIYRPLCGGQFVDRSSMQPGDLFISRTDTSRRSFCVPTHAAGAHSYIPVHAAGAQSCIPVHAAGALFVSRRMRPANVVFPGVLLELNLLYRWTLSVLVLYTDACCRCSFLYTGACYRCSILYTGACCRCQFVSRRFNRRDGTFRRLRHCSHCRRRLSRCPRHLISNDSSNRTSQSRTPALLRQ